MKKIIKVLIVSAVVAMVAAFSGCSVSKWIDQQRCEHKWDDGKVTVEATCTEEGERTFTCEKCKKTETEVIVKVPHTNITVEEVKATCTKSGWTDYTKCSVCDTITSEVKEIAALGHNEIKLQAVAATCTTSGLTEGVQCERCKELIVEQTEIAPLGHDVVTVKGFEATCTAVGKTDKQSCVVCKKVFAEAEEIPSLGHTYNAGTIIAEPTCVKEGVKLYACVDCGASRTETLAATGEHTIAAVKGYSATCDKDGLTDGQACTVCGFVEVEQTTIPATGHIGEAGEACTVCGKGIYYTESNYKLVSATSGETAVGNWYRIYVTRYEAATSDYVGRQGNIRIGNIPFVTYNGYLMELESPDCAKASSIFLSFEGSDERGEYIDIFVEADSSYSFTVNGESYTATVGENATITYEGDEVLIYRIEEA